MFVELGPELAAERGIEHGGWMTVRTPRGAISARAMVTRRLQPLVIDGRVTLRGFVDVPARGVTEKILTHTFEGPAVYRGTVRLRACVITVMVAPKKNSAAQRRDLDNPQEHAGGSEAQEHGPDHEITTAITSIRQSMGLPLREMLAHRR